MSIRPVHHKSNIYLEESCDFHPLKKSIREIHVREIEAHEFAFVLAVYEVCEVHLNSPITYWS